MPRRFGDAARGRRNDLHQPVRARGRGRRLDELALLACDCIDQCAVGLRLVFRNVGNAENRERDRIDQDAAVIGGLADQHHAARVAVFIGDRCEEENGRLIGAACDVVVKRDGILLFVDRIQQAQRADIIALRELRTFRGRRLKRAIERKIFQSEMRPRDLSVIGGREARRFFIGGLCRGFVAAGFRGAALPVKCTRERNRMVRDAFQAARNASPPSARP
jgi:hypothetical protein